MAITIRLDQATEVKECLNFAMVKVQVDQAFPKHICFENEKGCEVTQAVEYEWLPITCSNCKGLGHSVDDCNHKKQHVNKKWVAKKVQKFVDEEGFQFV